MANKIKTIKASTPFQLDKEVNEFGEKNHVFATQTHVNIVQGNPATTIYTAVIFYKDDEK